METAQRLTGTGGGPASTSRPSAILPGIPGAPSSASMGALFAREYEQATERIEAQASRTRRLDDQDLERRSLRKDEFGASGREDGSEASAQVQVTPRSAEPRSPDPVASEARERGNPSPAESSPMTPPTGTSEPATDTQASSHAPTPEAAAPAVAAVPVLQVPAANAAPSPTLPPAATSTGQGRFDVSALEGVSARTVQARPERAAAASASSGAPDTEAVDRAQEILRQIKLHLSPGVRRLTLDLEPAELGRLAIQLTWRPGRVSAIVRAGEAQTLQLLEQSEDELRSVLAERGILADSIRFESGFDGSATEGRTPTPRRAPQVRAPVSSTEKPPAALELRSSPLPSGDANVDTYA